MVKKPKRKTIRLKDFDYSRAGYYFVTICTKDKINILSRIVKGGPLEAVTTEPTLIGKEIVSTIEFIGRQSENIVFDKYVIMPNHLHAIIALHRRSGGGGTPPLQKIIGQLKSFTTKKYNEINGIKGLILWQRSFYDHIIRNEKDYRRIWNYIDTNPAKWEEDRYYIP